MGERVVVAMMGMEYAMPRLEALRASMPVSQRHPWHFRARRLIGGA